MTKTAVITGATSGFGLEAARIFVKDGWRVIGTGRRTERLDALAEELGPAFRPAPFDMRDLAAVEAFAAEAGAVDFLLNNAGLAPPLEPLQDADWDPLATVIGTNVTGLVQLTRLLLPGLIEKKGVIVNLSSVAANYPYRGGAVYGGSKAFLRQFSLCLRADLHGTGVRVTSIEPGMAETEFTLVRNGGDQAASDALYGGVGAMTGEDIARTIHWIASLPPHLNINALELMPVNQDFAGFAVARPGL
ncbi:MAG TPA: SDR family NAD(P)-dependent oxidoreductase [Allosphingosinicella sp.]|nr:SDR family NAD(P)-dependent oxidoreductase [Allosphingosinicella sp.]